MFARVVSYSTDVGMADEKPIVVDWVVTVKLVVLLAEK
jgi:hypothetical protein